MSYSLSSPVTGTAQTGLTSPTYTHGADVAPDINGKQVAVTAVGGTQAGVTIHSISSPFTTTFVRPKNYRLLPSPSPITGVIKNVPKNTFKLITRKGVTPAASQPASVMIVTTTIDIPAGADTYDAANVRAALSMHFGSLSQQSAGVGDTCISGVL